MFNQMKMKGYKGKEEEEEEADDIKISYIFGVLLLIVLLGFYAITYAIDISLPTPLKISDEPENPNEFIAERASDYLRPLTDMGPKIAGGHTNEVFAVEYLRSQIRIIIDEAHTNQNIELDLQVVSGSFYLDYKPHGTIFSYANVQNIVVKVYSRTISNHSVLINTHFDTVPTSPGGSDDGINVAVALEVLRKLSQLENRPQNNLIFLFNGAEEAGLVAAHGFITQHKWAPEVTVVVNLEATGGGGKEILFQTGPDAPWLMDYYDVPHPHGNAAGEEVFQSNIIPSDTDFRIFRDFGGVVGYDMAYTRDGYRYHTKYDGFENNKMGRYQHTGDNVLQLVKNLARAPEVSDPLSHGTGKTVFFDFLGAFMVKYSQSFAIGVNVITGIISILAADWSYTHFKLGCSRESWIYFGITLLAELLSWIVATSIVLILALILDAANRTMSWYCFPIIIVGLYCAPIVLCLCVKEILIYRFVKHDMTQAMKTWMRIHTIRLIFTVLLLIGTGVGLRLVYVVLVPILFNAGAMIILQCFRLYKSVKVWPIIYLASTVLPMFFLMSYLLEMLGLFIPISGRFGPNTNPEFLVGLQVTLMVILITAFYIPLLNYVRKPWYIVLFLLAMFMAAFILCFSPVGFPYKFTKDSPKLQRFYLYHTKRIFTDVNGATVMNDSGFYFPHMDRNSPHSIKGVVPSMARTSSLSESCQLGVACGLPVTNSRSLLTLQKSIWIPANEPEYPTDISYTCDKIETSPNEVLYNFRVEGCDRIDIYLSPKEGVKVTSISLVDELPQNPMLWDNRPTYFFSFLYGKDPHALDFSFQIEKEANFVGPLVEIAISAKYVHDDKIKKTAEYENFINEFPDWTVHCVTALAYYKSILLQ